MSEFGTECGLRVGTQPAPPQFSPESGLTILTAGTFVRMKEVPRLAQSRPPVTPPFLSSPPCLSPPSLQNASSLKLPQAYCPLFKMTSTEKIGFRCKNQALFLKLKFIGETMVSKVT